MIDTLGFSSIAAFIVLGIIDLFMIDKMLRRVHEHYPTEWERLGQPGGFFWWPKGCRFWRGCSSRNKITRFLVFKRPDWVDLDANLVAWWKKVRAIYAISILAWTVGMIYILTPRNETSEPSPGAYSSKAADGLTGNAQE